MSEPFATSVSRSAGKLVAFRGHRAGAVLDFSRASLAAVAEMADEAAQRSARSLPAS